MKRTAKTAVIVLAFMAAPFVFLGWPSAALVSVVIWLIAQAYGLLRIAAL